MLLSETITYMSGHLVTYILSLSLSSHETRVKHVVIESKFDPITGILYHITPSGPFFPSLYELIEEAQRKPLIQNHMFDIKLEQCPPKVHQYYAVYCNVIMCCGCR